MSYAARTEHLLRHLLWNLHGAAEQDKKRRGEHREEHGTDAVPLMLQLMGPRALSISRPFPLSLPREASPLRICEAALVPGGYIAYGEGKVVEKWSKRVSCPKAAPQTNGYWVTRSIVILLFLFFSWHVHNVDLATLVRNGCPCGKNGCEMLAYNRIASTD